MTGLEWVGVVSMVCLMPLGFLLVFMLFLERWAEGKHLRKALLTFYIAKLQRENRNKKGKGA